MTQDNDTKGNEAASRGTVSSGGTTKGMKVLLVAALLTSLAGIGVSAELTRVHHRAHSAQKSSCDISKKVSCSSLALTPESVVLGVPISVWGMAFYLAICVLVVWGIGWSEHRGWPFGLLLIPAVGSVGYSLYLGYLAYIKYKVVCIWCTALYVVSALLLGISLGAIKMSRQGLMMMFKEDLAALRRRWPVTLVSAMLALLTAASLIYCYPHGNKTKTADVDFGDKIKVSSTNPGKEPHKEHRSVGMKGSSRDGGAPDAGKTGSAPKVGDLPLLQPHTPGTGSANPDVVVVELSDYECPFCARSHHNVMKALQKYRHRLRLYHRHFPLDKRCNRMIKEEFHLTSCAAARAGICARKQGKFWEMHDLLFSHKTHKASLLTGFAGKLGLDIPKFNACIKDAETMKELKADIELAIRLKAQGTPTYVFYGKDLNKFVISGLIGVDLFDKLFVALDRARKNKKQG